MLQNLLSTINVILIATLMFYILQILLVFVVLVAQAFIDEDAFIKTRKAFYMALIPFPIRCFMALKKLPKK